MAKLFAKIVTNNAIVVNIDGKVHTVERDSKNFNSVKDALNKGDIEAVVNLIDIQQGLVNYASGNVTIADGIVTWRDRKMANALTKRMIDMMQEGFEIDSLIKFMDNLMENPSKTSVEELYGFLECNELPITEDGCFLAYKKVREDYLDIYTGTIDNSPGQVVSMLRNEVNDNRNQTCSSGLHFCSIDYLPHFGSRRGNRCVILKINPKDVVSIPSDYNNAKGRCCLYEVVGEWTKYRDDNGDQEGAFTKSVVSDEKGVSEGVTWVGSKKVASDNVTLDDVEVYTDGTVRNKKTGRFISRKVYDRLEAERQAYEEEYADGRTVHRDSKGRFAKKIKQKTVTDANGYLRDSKGRFVSR